MNCHIAYLSDTEVRWPPSDLRDLVIARVAEILSAYHFPDFSWLAMYFHLLGPEPNSFGMKPGVVRIRLSRRDDQMVATWAVDKATYDLAPNDDARAAITVDGVLDVLRSIFKRYKIGAEQTKNLESMLENLRLETETGQLTS